MAGSFDNEAVAIFALVTTFYLWVRAVNRGTVSAAVACAFAYLYMAASWCGLVPPVCACVSHLLCVDVFRCLCCIVCWLLCCVPCCDRGVL